MGFYGLRMGFYGVRTGYARVAQNQVLMGFMGCERVLNGVLRCMDGFPTGFYGVSTGCGRVPAFSSLRISQKVFKTKWNPKPTSMILQFSTNNRSPNFKGPSWMNFIIFDKPDIHSMFKFLWGPNSNLSILLEFEGGFPSANIETPISNRLGRRD